MATSDPFRLRLMTVGCVTGAARSGRLSLGVLAPNWSGTLIIRCFLYTDHSQDMQLLQRAPPFASLSLLILFGVSDIRQNISFC